MALSDDPSAPLQLADGTYINPFDGSVIKPPGAKASKPKYVEIPSGSEAQAMVARSRRAVGDLPLPPQQMNVVALIVTYTMWGLTDEDIALTTSLSTAQVKNIKTLTAYTTMLDDVMSGVLQHETTNVRNFFQQNAMTSAQKIVDLAEDADGALGFAAARDVLDRAGHRPADVVEHRHSMENALRIEVVRKTEDTIVPILETTWTEK